MRVSVHICAKDRSAELAQLLTSLKMQSFKDWDLVIVDGSQPNPLHVFKFVRDAITRIRSEKHGVQYIKEQTPLGVCQARNRALNEDKFKNPVIARVDDDAILEPDWLEKLVKLMERKNTGGAGGIVPVWGSPPIYRNTNLVHGIFNRITFNEKGELEKLSDDGGYLYTPPMVLNSHHLRSCFLFDREAALNVGGFPTYYGTSGFREETDFSVKLLMQDLHLWTDTSAIAWHNICPSGGVRAPDYIEQVQRADKAFKTRIEHWYKTGKLKREQLAIRWEK